MGKSIAREINPEQVSQEFERRGYSRKLSNFFHAGGVKEVDQMGDRARAKGGQDH